jgi:hypothetical protein
MKQGPSPSIPTTIETLRNFNIKYCSWTYYSHNFQFYTSKNVDFLCESVSVCYHTLQQACWVTWRRVASMSGWQDKEAWQISTYVSPLCLYANTPVCPSSFHENKISSPSQFSPTNESSNSSSLETLKHQTQTHKPNLSMPTIINFYKEGRLGVKQHYLCLNTENSISGKKHLL